jgi:phosphate starvation-inducible protein PhoH
LNINEYLLVYDKNNNLVDKYKYLGKGKFNQVKFIAAESKMFGKIKPIDPYQELVLDSFKSNQLTLVKGPAGTGKSLLSLAYLFRLMEKGEIDKIIIFCNTIATAGSAKLGYYPGDRTEKLLDSQIGNFLVSKLGARE